MNKGKVAFLMGLSALSLYTAGCSQGSSGGQSSPERRLALASPFETKDVAKVDEKPAAKITNWEKILGELWKKGILEKGIVRLICREDRNGTFAAVCEGGHRFVKKSICGRISTDKNFPKADDVDFMKKWKRYVDKLEADKVLLAHEASVLYNAPAEILHDLFKLCAAAKIDDGIWEKSADGCAAACKKLGFKATAKEPAKDMSSLTPVNPIGTPVLTTYLATETVEPGTGSVCTAGTGLFSQYSCEPGLDAATYVPPTDDYSSVPAPEPLPGWDDAELDAFLGDPAEWWAEPAGWDLQFVTAETSPLVAAPTAPAPVAPSEPAAPTAP